MLFENLVIYDRFTIEEEPESLFYKIDNRYDGAVNTRQIKSRNNENVFKPVIFSRGYAVQKTTE